MIDKLDLINEDNQEDELQVIGWYHTHPGRLSVFMSGTDLNTQSKMFSMVWQFAIVLNPQKQLWRAFSGSKAKECKGYMLK
jgi:proteasome lid subunit RPN8/RPN11